MFASECELELANSWIVSDSISEVLTARNARCRGSVFVRAGHGERFTEAKDSDDFLATDPTEAAHPILELAGDTQ